MSRSNGETSIPHRYRKGKDGGVRKSPYRLLNKQRKKPEVKDDKDLEVVADIAKKGE